MKNIESLKDLYFDQLHDIISVERQLVRHLADLSREATSSQLRLLLEGHADQTRTQLERLQHIFRRHHHEPDDDPSKAMEGLIAGGLEHVRSVRSESVRDALIIAHTNRIEHYEIAAYGTVVGIAGRLGFADDAELLTQSLDEEKEADANMTTLATGSVGAGALEEAE